MRRWIGFVARLWLVAAVLLGAWGFDDISGFFAHRARLGLVLVFVALSAAGTFVCPQVGTFEKGEKRTGMPLLYVWIAVSLVISIWYPYGDRRGYLLLPASLDWLRYAGLALVAAGMGFRMSSALWLGRQFSGYVAIQKEHQLVQTGPYAVIRHPMYTGLIVVYAGLGLVFRSWLALAGVAMTIAFVLVRIRQEERLLAEHFGAVFEEYRRRTSRLLPRIF